SFLILLIGCFMTTDGFAQRKKGKSRDVDQYFDESGGFKHRLWYGGGFNLGFNGFNGVTQFNIGISPMVGYKIFEKLSVGPRIALDYTFIKFPVSQNLFASAQPVSFSIGAFTRFKILPTIFAHAEYEWQNRGSIYDEFNNIIFKGNDNVQIFHYPRNNTYLGLGYNSGGGLFGYEIYGLYNFNVDNTTSESPFVLRIGFTYKF
ncbi:MAG: hypothetical protein AAFO94_22365, partial [Bacteroidota bacterium]